MCLDRLYLENETRRWRQGWKVFFLLNNELYAPIQGSRGGKIPIGQWLDEDDFTYSNSRQLNLIRPGSYPRGWHTFARLREAKKMAERFGKDSYPIYRVTFKEVMATGPYDGSWNINGPVIVSRFIYIHPGIIH